MPDGSATAHLYRPKLLSLVAEGYGWARLKRDVPAALTEEVARQLYGLEAHEVLDADLGPGLMASAPAFSQAAMKSRRPWR